MPPGNVIPFPQGVAKVLTLAELQDCGAWRRALQNKCKDNRYYEIVEETLQCGFEHHYLRLEDNSGNVRAIQPVFFVRQNLVEGVPGKIRSIVDFIRKIFPVRQGPPGNVRRSFFQNPKSRRRISIAHRFAQMTDAAVLAEDLRARGLIR